MRRIIHYISVFTLVAVCAVVGSCSDDDGVTVNKISIMQTEYDSDEKALVIRIKDNQELQLVPLIFPIDADNQKVEYSNENTSIMEVSASGVLKGKTPGTDVLKISAADGSGTVQVYKVFVKDHRIKATAIAFAAEDKNMSIPSGATVDLTPKVIFTPEDTYDKSLTFSSSDEEVAKVDANGVLSGLKAGEATITVTTADGSNVSATSTVTVTPDFYRGDWSMSLTWNSSASPDFHNVIDGNVTTFMNIPKPIRHAAGPPSGEPFGFIIDLGVEKTFNYFRFLHRNDQLGLRLRKLSLFGSNNGTDYQPINPQGITVKYEPQSFQDIGDQDITESTYRYVKIICDDWDKNNNSVIQITEFYLGSK